MKKIGFFLDFKVFKGCMIFWYLFIVMVIRLGKMVEEKVWEKIDIVLYWIVVIVDDGIVSYIMIGKIRKW